MKNTFVFIMFLVTTCVFSQNEEVVSEIQIFQDALNEHYINPETSILLPENIKGFDGLRFYPINLKFRVEAEFIRTPNEIPFLMPTSTERTPEYVKYGEAHFTIDNEGFVLSLFQNTKLSEEVDNNYLFLPVTDLTSGDGSYGGGRYLDLNIPEGNRIIIDFNKAYNPYCAYNPKYSCPIPPPENDLLIRIEAGVKDYEIIK